MVTPEQRSKNRRTGLVLAAIAIIFFLWVIVRQAWFG